MFYYPARQRGWWVAGAARCFHHEPPHVLNHLHHLGVHRTHHLAHVLAMLLALRMQHLRHCVDDTHGGLWRHLVVLGEVAQVDRPIIPQP